MKSIEHTNLLLTTNTQLKKLRMNLFAVWQSEFMAKHFEKINGAQYFCDGCLIE